MNTRLVEASCSGTNPTPEMVNSYRSRALRPSLDLVQQPGLDHTPENAEGYGRDVGFAQAQLFLVVVACILVERMGGVECSRASAAFQLVDQYRMQDGVHG